MFQHLGRVILLLFVSIGIQCSELSWDQLLADLRQTTRTGPYAIYIGSRANLLPRMILKGIINLKDIPLCVISSSDRIINPWTNQVTDGLNVQRMFSSTAGTLIFLNSEGVPIQQLMIPQAMHGNDEALINLYFEFLHSHMYDKMNISEYASAIGAHDVIEHAIARIRNGFLGRELRANEKLVLGINHVSGNDVDPWKEPGVFCIYATNVHGRVFLAQVKEIAEAFRGLQPRFTLIVPEGQVPDLSDLPEHTSCVLGHADARQLAAQGPSPLLVFTTGGEHPRGLRLEGFQPASVLVRLLRLSIHTEETYNPDMPYGETDDQQSSAAPAASVQPPPLGTSSSTSIMNGIAP